MQTQLTTLSQFGARRSIAELHIKRLLRACLAGRSDVNHIFYLVDSDNRVLGDYLQGVARGNGNITVLSRRDNNVTPFGRLRRAAPMGGDCNYDFLIRRPEVGRKFVTLHDDSMLLHPDFVHGMSEILSDNVYAGMLDTRSEIDAYRNISLDGIPMSEQRLGTWFTAGDRDDYLRSDYRIGDYRTHWKWFLYAKYGFNPRLHCMKQRIWLNGGFDFNIRARLEGKCLHIMDHDAPAERWAVHMTKVTGFFAAEKRKMISFADRPDEVERWKERINDPKRTDEENAFDYAFLLNLAEELESEDVYDHLLNSRTLNELFRCDRR